MYKYFIKWPVFSRYMVQFSFAVLSCLHVYSYWFPVQESEINVISCPEWLTSFTPANFQHEASVKFLGFCLKHWSRNWNIHSMVLKKIQHESINGLMNCSLHFSYYHSFLPSPQDFVPLFADFPNSGQRNTKQHNCLTLSSVKSGTYFLFRTQLFSRFFTSFFSFKIP